VDQPFEYKYVVVQSGNAIRWERGLNRLCHPSSLKSKELFDEWEHFKVCFSIYYPGKSATDFMRINGDTNRLGDWNKGAGPLIMKQGKEQVRLTGEKIRPWEITVRFSSVDFPERLLYKYSL